MRMSARTLSTAVFGVALLMFSTACGPKKIKDPAPPPVQPTGNTGRIGEPTAPTTPGARITTFTAEPRTIERGQSATLRWAIANATDMTIDQNLGAVTATGSRQVFPSQTTTYTLTAVGPTGQDARSVTVEVATGPPPPPPDGNRGARLNGTEVLTREAQDVYFDYDKAEFRDDARQALAHNAEVLKRIFAADPRFNVVIEGHCDERGSAEYNLGLGDRRASAAKEYLVQLGVPADRLTTISYGKERPQCTDADEACYQKNRRAHLGPGR